MSPDHCREYSFALICGRSGREGVNEKKKGLCLQRSFGGGRCLQRYVVIWLRFCHVETNAYYKIKLAELFIIWCANIQGTNMRELFTVRHERRRCTNQARKQWCKRNFWEEWIIDIRLATTDYFHSNIAIFVVSIGFAVAESQSTTRLARYIGCLLVYNTHT